MCASDETSESTSTIGVTVEAAAQAMQKAAQEVQEVQRLDVGIEDALRQTELYRQRKTESAVDERTNRLNP